MNDIVTIEHGIKHDRSQGLIEAAFRFAMTAHEGQVRKYTGEPYIFHCVAVARLVAEVTDDCEMISAALLHDVKEDCGVTDDDLIKAGFGRGIADLVDELSDVSKLEDGNRTIRKELDRQHIAKASVRAKTIKLADLIDNSRTIIEHDPAFAEVYIAEMAELLKVLTDGSAFLYGNAVVIIESFYN